jgi:hypothetical protein
MGAPAYNTWTSIAQLLFTNIVWWKDEFNVMCAQQVRPARRLRGDGASMAGEGYE